MDAADLQYALVTLIAAIQEKFQTELSSIWLPIQFGLIAVAAIAAVATAAIVRKRYDLLAATDGWPAWSKIAIRAVVRNFGTLVFIAVLSMARIGAVAWSEHPRVYLLNVAINLATAWVIIAIATGVIRNPFINRAVAISAWTIAALSIVGLLEPVVAALDARAIVIGGARITPLLVLKATVLLLAALWIAIDRKSTRLNSSH
mgnify:CR=1 FL=1